MRLARFMYRGKTLWGILEGSTACILKSHPFGAIQRSPQRVSINKLKLLIPAEPTKIVLAGLNYKDHAKELGQKIPAEPIIFLKPPTAAIAHNQAIHYPKTVGRLDYEAELAIVIRKKGKNIKENRALDHVLGYTCLNDVTARDLQKKDGQWTRAKSFDTFCPIGPWIETDIKSDDVLVRLFLNGALRQQSSTKNFIFSVARLISFISCIMTIMPGDVISTGTPAGIGAMKRGDDVSVDIEGIGILNNHVV